jgi:hypothetical protein
MSTVAENFGSGGIYATAQGFLAGLECEIESVKGGPNDLGNFKVVPDGSLRNHGAEYVTAFPQARKRLIDDFTTLHKSLKLGEEPFSERTSTHVHINVSSMQVEHARQMVLLYALFEEFFFCMVKPNRRDNIHCVPLTETPLPGHYHKQFTNMVPSWSKYTALNLGRVRDLGTMEFRHMHGTNDVELMNIWLNVLENLWTVAQRVTIDEKTLSDRKNIMEWFEAIFFPADKVMMLKPSLFDIIRNSLIDVKLSTLPK